MKYDPISRRHFLQGLGGLTLALPFLPSLLPKSALAQSAAPDPCFVAWWLPHGGLMPDSIFPAMDADIPVSSTSGHTFYRKALQPNFSPIIGSNFNPLLSQMNVIRGLDTVQYLGHNQSGMLGNMRIEEVSPNIPDIATIDQILAYSTKFYQSVPPVRSISVNPTGSNGISLRWSDPLAQSGSIQPITSVSDPRVLFDALFTGGSAGGVDVLNSVHGDYSSLRNNSRLGAADRQVLDQHLDYLTDLRNRIAVASLCTPPSRPASADVWSDPTESYLRTVTQLLIDVVVAALKCRVTRIATFRFDYVQLMSDFHTEAHSCEQGASQNQIFQRYQAFMNNVVFYLLNKMNTTLDSDGNSLLHNSLVMGAPEANVPHTLKTSYMFTGGSVGGRINTGNYFDYRDRFTSYQNGITRLDGVIKEVLKPGYLYNRFLVTVLQAFGLSPQDYERPRSGVFSYGGYGHVFPVQSNWSPEMTSDYVLMSSYYPLEHTDKPLPALLA